MPKKYEAMRDKFKEPKSSGGGGLSDMMAKQKAARIFNAQRGPGEAPVTNRPDTAPPSSPATKKPRF